MKSESKKNVAKSPTRPWVKPRLKSVGNVGEVLKGGGGKLSEISQDPGDSRKPAGQG